MLSSNLFNERSSQWIKIYKYIVVALFWIYIFIATLFGIGDASATFMDFDIGGDDGFLDFILWVIIGGGAAFIQLVVNMLVIQFLNNVQLIREKIEKM